METPPITTDRKKLLRKPKHQRHVRVAITLPPSVYELGNGVLSKYKFPGYSDYLAACIRKHSGLDIAA